MPDVGEYRIIDATTVDFPLWLSVSNEDQFHGEVSLSAAAGAAAMSVGPATFVPMATKVGRVNGYGNNVSGSRRDVAVASWTEVSLVCFVGLDAADLNFESHRIAFGFGGHFNRRMPR